MIKVKADFLKLKEVVDEYNRINFEAPDSCYGNLMIDTDDGEVWVDEFCDFTHNQYIIYRDEAICNVMQDYWFENETLDTFYGASKKRSAKTIAEFCKKHYGIEFA